MMKKPDLKLKKPEIKLPSLNLKRPGGKGPKLDVKAPRFVNDVYADLRDRRLLPLVALLLVAIIAAPILLSGGGEETEPAPALTAPGADASSSQASFTVVPAAPALRDYRRRLSHRDARDPFDQPVSPDSSGASASSGGEAGGSSGSSTEESAPEGKGSETPTEAPVVVEGGQGKTDAPKTTTDVVVKNKVIGYEIDTRAGFVDHVKPHDGIAPTTKLPSPQNPVIVFMGLSKDKKRALFLLSSKVTAYYGKAHCALDKQACQLVELKPGKSATFAYGYGEARYKLFLKEIVTVVDTRRAEATVTTNAADDSDGMRSGK